jgi:hypothetical protein
MKAIGIRRTATRPGSQLDLQSPLNGQEKESATNFMGGLLRTVTFEHAFGRMVAWTTCPASSHYLRPGTGGRRDDVS